MNYLFEGKKNLNKYVTTLSLYGVEFRIYYWGGWERYFGTKEHMHSFFEVSYVLDGIGQYRERNISYPLSPRSLVLSRPNYEHQLYSEQGMKFLYFAFDVKQYDSDYDWKKYMECLKHEISPVLSAHEESMYTDLWKVLYQAAIEVDHMWKKQMLENLASQLLSTIFDCFYPLPKQKETSPEDSFDEHKVLIERVYLYIKDNLQKNIKISDVAEDFYVSKRHLSRLFKEETGKTFTEVLQEERLSLATDYLRRTNKSIKDIAVECGFSSLHYFTKVFTQIMRNPPAKYRKMYKETINAEFKDR